MSANIVSAVIVIGLLYFLPFLVAHFRRHNNTTAIFILNFFLGWTFIGWIIAMVWAFANDGGFQYVFVGQLDDVASESQKCATLKRGGVKENHTQRLPYRVKRYFFSRSEKEFLRILNKNIDRRVYTVFPKVRLADFIEVKAEGKEFWKWWGKVKSKHVDFILWNHEENRVVMAVEVDGKSHNSQKMKKRDDFVDQLYQDIELPFVRVRVGSDFQMKAEKISGMLAGE